MSSGEACSADDITLRACCNIACIPFGYAHVIAFNLALKWLYVVEIDVFTHNSTFSISFPAMPFSQEVASASLASIINMSTSRE